MAKGRKKTPTPILKLRGSRCAKGRELEPKPIGVPVPPVWLDKDELVFWHSVVPLLVDMGVVATVDSFKIGRYCRAACQYMTESTKPNRAFSQMKSLESQMDKFESSFGMSASSRASLKVEKPKEKNPFSELKKA